MTSFAQQEIILMCNREEHLFMPKKIIKTRVSKYAKKSEEALHFSRKIIRKGATWGDHAQLVKNKWIAKKGYEDIFMGCNQGVMAVRKDRLYRANIELEFDEKYFFFESIVSSAFKFSLGSCHELTCMALYFCIKNNIHAEYYEGINIDHTFLVIGRKKGSDPTDPSTWGPDAMICDPWDNQSYPAKELDHHFKPLFGHGYQITSAFCLRNTCIKRTVKNLKESFCTRFQAMQCALDEYFFYLENMSSDLTPEKKFIVQNKINKIKEYVSTIPEPTVLFEQCHNAAKEIAKKEQQDEWLDEYSLTRSYLINNLEKLHDQIKKEMTFSPSEFDKLDNLFWYSKIVKVLIFF